MPPVDDSLDLFCPTLQGLGCHRQRVSMRVGGCHSEVWLHKLAKHEVLCRSSSDGTRTLCSGWTPRLKEPFFAPDFVFFALEAAPVPDARLPIPLGAGGSQVRMQEAHSGPTQLNSTHSTTMCAWHVICKSDRQRCTMYTGIASATPADNNNPTAHCVAPSGPWLTCM